MSLGRGRAERSIFNIKAVNRETDKERQNNVYCIHAIRYVNCHLEHENIIYHIYQIEDLRAYWVAVRNLYSIIDV